ncbi:unnamed protein product [Cylindrotheca closterium]|uniref:Bulb-type lectin domain-containing protein n=1 Tax=Cylindrotheca closterium TaxID=2856 RepID=A0AAD2FAS9_9STRA|nr:unnamed protein product [Cylindrotheca closterium]
MARRTRRSNSPRSSTERSSDEEVVEVTTASSMSSKKRRSRRSSRYSTKKDSTGPSPLDEEARNEGVRASQTKSKKHRSSRSSRHLTENGSSDVEENEVVKASHRSSKRRSSRRSSRYSAEPASDEEENERAIHRISKIAHSHRSSRVLVISPSDEDDNDLLTTTSSKKTRRSRRSSVETRRDNCRLMIGAGICTLGIFVAVVAVILILQRQNTTPDEGLIAQEEPPTAAPQYSVPSTKEPTASPTSERTTSPAPSTTFSPSDSPSFYPSVNPSVLPSIVPSAAPSVNPSESPTITPTSEPSPAPTTTFRPTSSPTPPLYPRTIVLQSRQFLQRGEFVSSPSRDYRVGLSTTGEFVLLDSDGNEIWRPDAMDAIGAEDLYLQADGNLVMRDASGDSMWSTKTSTSSASLFVLDDGGIIGLIQTFRTSTESTFVWMKGVPRGTYNGQPDGSAISYPIRGAFYYPWFPETWTVGGKRAKFAPDVGWYHSGDPTVVRKHIEQLEYGRIDLGVAAWFGIDTNNDIGRITQILELTEASNSPLKWALYYEMFEKVRTVEEIRSDLEYIKKWYCWHPSYAHIAGKPVIFIYQSRGCDIIQNWVEASQGEWYLVPKIFIGYGGCDAQLNPGKYHQYAPAQAVEQYDGLAFTISPGFWKADEDEPRLARLDKSTWCQNVQSMVDSNAPWQLVTTFNEAGEGTIIEPSRANWPSASGYGIYLDCLHDVY